MIIPKSLDKSICAGLKALKECPNLDLHYKHKHSVMLGRNLERLASKAPNDKAIYETISSRYSISKSEVYRYRFVAKEPGVALHRALAAGKWSLTLVCDGRKKVSDEERAKAAETCKADKKRMGYATGGARNGDSNDWRTPVPYLESARKVLGGIELDPFSSDDANRQVRARRFLTEHDNALSCNWPKVKSAWMNPPYGRTLMTPAAERWCAEYESGTFDAGIALVNNATEAKWFLMLWDRASAFLFTDHRIAFESPDHKTISSNTRGQFFFYFGEQCSRFIDEFARFGKGMAK